MLEVVDAELEAAADFLHAMRVRDDRLARRVRRLHDRGDFGVGHLVLVDQLDEVDARGNESLHFRLRVLGAAHSPAKRLLVLLVRRVLDERARHKEPRTGDLVPLDLLLDRDDVVERRAEVARARDAGAEQLLRRDGHDEIGVARAVQVVPPLVVAVAEDLEVHVHVDEARHDGHAVGVDRPHARGNGDGAGRTDGGDALARDEDHAVLDRRPAVAVEDAAAGDGERDGLRGVIARREPERSA